LAKETFGVWESSSATVQFDARFPLMAAQTRCLDALSAAASRPAASPIISALCGRAHLVKL
jgi:hypothetical protein